MPSPRLTWLAIGGAALYCAAVTWYLLTHGGAPTPDFLVPPLLLLALLLRRGRAFLLDWTPFLALLLAWEATRGIADLLGMPVHVTGPLELEKALFFGHLPTLELQRRLFDPERGSRWFDWVGAMMHSLHFVLPVVVGFALWLRDRALYWRYVLSVLALFLLAFAGYVLYPQAPPWLAPGLGADLPYLYRIGVGTILTLPMKGQVILLYDHIRPNDVAAMPSLHGALPLLIALILWRLSRPLALAALVYTATLAFFLVYFAEHYVIDLLAGWALAGLVYWLVWATPAWLRRRLPASTPALRRAVAAPATALGALILVVGTAAALRPGAFGQEPSALTPPPPEEQAQPVEHIAVTGPCGSTRSLAGVADELLAPVAAVYAAYLIDPELGLCLALTGEQPIPPPERAEQGALTALGGTPAAPAATVLAGHTLRLSATGPASPRLTAAGLPPGRYLLVVLMEGAPDEQAARRAAAGVAEAVLDGA